MDDTLSTINQIDDLEIARSMECKTENITQYINFNQSDFVIVSQNIRSVYCNMDNLLVVLRQFNFNVDVIILSECRLHPDKSVPKLDDYTNFSTSNHLNQNDGVVAYIKNSHAVKVKEVILTHASCLEITTDAGIILGIYRSPSNNNADRFISDLDVHLVSIKSSKNIFLTGDININIANKINEQSYEQTNRLNYLNMMAVHGLMPGHSLPTRDKACLDHFMLKLDQNCTKPDVLILDATITDHAMILLRLDNRKNTNHCRVTKTNVNFDKALSILARENIGILFNITDPNLLTEILINTIRRCLSESTIITLVPRNNRIIKPWITQGLLRCIRNRNNMQKSCRSNPDNIVLKITYKRYRNYCNNIIRKLKHKYEKEQLTKASRNPRKIWKAINTIANRKQDKVENTELLHIRNSPSDSVNAVNQYFSDIGKALAEVILSQNSQFSAVSNKPATTVNSFVLFETDPSEVSRILFNLKTSSAPGWDNIPTQFLKLANDTLVPIISHLANLCFNQGVFPNALKQAVITPVYKSGNRDNVSNYRPISVLPSISKIIEKIINNRLINYLDKFNLLSNAQYGFRRGISTVEAISSLTSLIVNNVDKNKKCLAVFLDIKKAFDTVSVPILVNTLETIGIRDTPLRLFTSYLEFRTQKVKVGNHVSDQRTISYGVPQGSVLGPTLFLIYINQLCNMKIEGGTIFTYADDTAIVFSGDTWDDVRLAAEHGLSKVARWLNVNLLTLNTAKTNFICFTNYNRTQPDSNFSIRIHSCDNNNQTCSCSVIDKVETTRYLGIILDQRLTWHHHTESLMSRMRKLIWVFKNLRHVATKAMLKQIYISLAESILTYCIPVWGGATKTKFLELERAQRSLLKVIHTKPYRFPTTQLYMTADVLSVRKLYILNLILKTHKNTVYKPISIPTRTRNKNKSKIIHTPL
jgi:hypothetical protein